MKSRLQDQTSVVLSAKKVTSLIADNEGIKSRKAVSIIGGLFTGIGSSGDSVTLPPKTFQRHRETKRSDFSEEIKQNFDKSA